MNVTKRDGSTEAVDLNKILKSLQRATNNLSDVDPMIIAQATIASLQNNIQTKQIDEIAINLCAGKIAEEPNYGYVAARLLAQTISKEAGRDNTLWQVTEALFNTDQVTKQYRKFVKKHKLELEKLIDHDRDDNFTFFGLSVIKDRYLLKDKSGRILERPQHLWMRVAIALSETIQEVKEAYDAISKFYYMPSTPTLFNAGTPHPQMSSCYLMDVQEDSISGIYQTYADAAQLSKWAGGLGISWDEVRATGSFINGTKGRSTGLIPFLKTLDSSVKAVNQAGKRRGSAAVYLSTWHADIEHFLELRDNTGLEAERTYNLNLANWIPDLFMERVDNDQDWSLFCPGDVPELKYTWGEKFNQVYLNAEQAGLARKTVKARELYKRMMTTLAETGNGWMNFKDLANRNHPQVEISGMPVTSSNLCVSGETWTLTEDGPKQVKDLVGSKQRLVVNGKVEETTDKGFWKTGHFETYCMVVSSGKSVRATEDHKFLRADGIWTELKNLNVGDKLMMSEGGDYSNPDFKVDEIVLKYKFGFEDVYDCTVPSVSEFDANGFRAHNCTEILEVRDYKSGEVSVCNLGSLVLSKFVDNSKGYLELHEGLLRETVRTAIRLLDRVIDRNFYPLEGAAKQNNKWRNIGLGTMGWHDTLMKLKIGIESQEARMLNKQLFSIIWDEAVKASEALAAVDGPFPAFKPTSVMPNPRRNSLLIAVAPTATIGSITGSSEGIEPLVSNLFRRETLTGEFIQINQYLVNDLKALGLWNKQMLNKLIDKQGSIQEIDEIPDNLKIIYKTAWELSMKSLINLAADRYKFIDQAQSLNLFIENPNVGKLSSMYMHAWKSGVKTTYYLRSRAASKTVSAKVLAIPDEDKIACSLENPENCESCQ